MSDSSVLEVFALGNPPWATVDPFLFCVHHDDAYPAGNEQMGPAASLRGRNIGMDFEGIDGWRMYHGDVVPGFPRHPHRGFETVTIARQGFIDHSDSLGATARFGQGDVQWMTAGTGIVHSEMFPLIDSKGPNPAELFQIWINLPHADKHVAPHFAMLWDRDIPLHQADGVKLRVVAGRIGSQVAPPPPPNSWAARADADVAIWTIELGPNASWTAPPASSAVNRTLYFFRGASVAIGEREVSGRKGVRVAPEVELTITNGPEPSELLLLQGRPIGEPVVQHGPFVMTTPAEIQQAFVDFRRTQFGGWPWPSDGPVHARTEGRFAIHADGRTERIDDAASSGSIE